MGQIIPFNKPFLTGKEAHYMYQAVYAGKLSGNGAFTKRCQSFFEQKYGFKKALMTTSCTDALEMCAILCNIKPGDEVIVPSYTFVSSALAFVRQGAHIIFADSCENNPNIDPNRIESLITEKTKVIVPVHYAGVACDMDKIMDIAEKHHLFVVEDAAQSIDSYYKGHPLGSIGHLAAFSFHETKNIISGEGGLLAINDDRFIRRAEIIWEKGTNRSEFFRGEVNKYGWVDTGSSFLPSEVISAFLYAQLENLDMIQSQRKHLWNLYYNGLRHLAASKKITMPDIPEYATNNAHMFYIVCKSLDERQSLIRHLKDNNIQAVFHYLSLHLSDYYTSNYSQIPALPNCDKYADCLVRLPLFYELKDENVEDIVRLICEFYEDKSYIE